MEHFMLYVFYNKKMNKNKDTKIVIQLFQNMLNFIFMDFHQNILNVLGFTVVK